MSISSPICFVTKKEKTTLSFFTKVAQSLTQLILKNMYAICIKKLDYLSHKNNKLCHLNVLFIFLIKPNISYFK